MRKLLILIFCILSLPLIAIAIDVPQPQGYVNDFAAVINAQYSVKLQQLVSEVEQKTGAEIAVVTIKSIAPYDEKEYAQQLFDNWKIGKSGKDNGVLVLLAVKERRWRIHTGYGLESTLPDGVCGDIGRNRMVPFFKQGNFGQGLYEGVSGIALIIANNTHVSLEYASNIDLAAQQSTSNSGITIVLIIVIVFVIISIILSLREFFGYRDYDYYNRSPWYRTDRYSSGGFGGYSGGGGGFGGGSSGGGGAGGGF